MTQIILERVKYFYIKNINNKTAQGLLEYGLIIILIAIVVMTILSLLGVQIGNLFQEVTESFPES